MEEINQTNQINQINQGMNGVTGHVATTGQVRLPGQVQPARHQQALEPSAASGRKRVEAVVETLAGLRGEGESLEALAHDARNMVTALGLYCDLLEEPGVLATEFAHYGSELRLVAAASRRLVEKLVSLDVRGNASPGNDGLGDDGLGNDGRENAERGKAGRENAASGDAMRGSSVRASSIRGSALRGKASPVRGGAPGSSARGTFARGRDIADQPAAVHPAGETGAVEDISFTVNSVAGKAAGAAAARERGGASGNVSGRASGIATRVGAINHWDMMPPGLISNLAGELVASRNLLSALAGPSVALTVEADDGALPVRLNAEDLTRVMVNLVKNAAEAMPGGGSIRIGLRRRAGTSEAGEGTGEALSLTFEDSGPGIPRRALERIFEAGFTTRATESPAANSSGNGWSTAHRGLGLSISRSIVEAAGGHIYATNCESPGTGGRGARFEIVLPVRKP